MPARAGSEDAEARSVGAFGAVPLLFLSQRRKERKARKGKKRVFLCDLCELCVMIFFIPHYSYATAGVADKSATPDDSGVRHGVMPAEARRTRRREASAPSARYHCYSSRKGAKDAKLAKGRKGSSSEISA